mmetsp:Transcript_53/g.62  ORF Transcript_53/g.62 Transcript_53/m.62 type:complete len:147 (-) Transcript_53:115-555(-)|eukprot:CAMPEP_0197236366 /NCGR_PEP_ID=MMETSP1429-20130617/3491_1 /TAXON_ID=49237 /ORGANISM="Chaetoceros  sp., Strain UNC1202" /LENGTH=146 /DNA_ID=CAMNT_0042695129 /DNA_START=63 /DNA_END=503 /DNA_ORIENTATION=+
MISRLSLAKASTQLAGRIRSVGSTRHLASGIKRFGSDEPNMSRSVVYNGVVTISGQVDTGGGDIGTQTKNVLGKVNSLLEEAGTDKSNLLTASIWLKDIETDFKTMNGIWNDWLDPENKPVRATVEANMAFPDFLIEIQVTAAIDE